MSIFIAELRIRLPADIFLVQQARQTGILLHRLPDQFISLGPGQIPMLLQ